MSKDDVLKYCEQFSPADIEHAEQAIENARMIKKGVYRYLNGCPANFGLDDYVGICEELPDVELDSQSADESNDMCEACWKRALGVDKDGAIDKGTED